jgi:hypothetical protein
MIGEAGFVATFHPTDKLDYIPFGPRFIGHLGINLTGYIATINAPKKWYEFFNLLPPLQRDALEVYKRKLKAANFTTGKLVGLFIYAALSTAISISLPVLNIIILANGLEQMVQFELFMMDLFKPMEQYYAALPIEMLGPNTKVNETVEYVGAAYSPFNDMRYPLQIVIAMVFVHYPLAFMKGIAGTIMRGGSSKLFHNDNGGPKKEDPKKEEKEELDPDIFTNIRKLLQFYGYTGTALNSKVTEANGKLKALESGLQATLAINLATVAKKVQKAKENGFINTSKTNVKRDIKIFFGQRHTTGHGFGITLSESMIEDGEEEDD